MKDDVAEKKAHRAYARSRMNKRSARRNGVVTRRNVTSRRLVTFARLSGIPASSNRRTDLRHSFESLKTREIVAASAAHVISHPGRTTGFRTGICTAHLRWHTSCDDPNAAALLALRTHTVRSARNMRRQKGGMVKRACMFTSQDALRQISIDVVLRNVMRNVGIRCAPRVAHVARAVSHSLWRCRL